MNRKLGNSPHTKPPRCDQVDVYAPACTHHHRVQGQFLHGQPVCRAGGKIQREMKQAAQTLWVVYEVVKRALVTAVTMRKTAAAVMMARRSSTLMTLPELTTRSARVRPTKPITAPLAPTTCKTHLSACLPTWYRALMGCGKGEASHIWPILQRERMLPGLIWRLNSL